METSYLKFPAESEARIISWGGIRLNGSYVREILCTYESAVFACP